MESKVIRINSRLYHNLFTSVNEGGDRLIATFVILKSLRGKSKSIRSFKSKNNKKVSGYALLRKQSNISLATLKKYVPILIEKGLAHFNTEGDFIMMGTEKINCLFSSEKVVPIIIGKNIVDTAHNVFYVRVHSMHRSQLIQIAKKGNQNELLMQVANPTNKKQYLQGKRLQKRLGVDKLEITDLPILSRMGFSKLKVGADSQKTISKSSGLYYKRILKDRGLVSTRRRFKKVSKMSYAEYKNIKKYSDSNCYTYINGYLSLELISSFSLLNSIVCK